MNHLLYDRLHTGPHGRLHRRASALLGDWFYCRLGVSLHARLSNRLAARIHYPVGFRLRDKVRAS